MSWAPQDMPVTGGHREAQGRQTGSLPDSLGSSLLHCYLLWLCCPGPEKYPSFFRPSSNHFSRPLVLAVLPPHSLLHCSTPRVQASATLTKVSNGLPVTISGVGAFQACSADFATASFTLYPETPLQCSPEANLHFFLGSSALLVDALALSNLQLHLHLGESSDLGLLSGGGQWSPIMRSTWAEKPVGAGHLSEDTPGQKLGGH